MGTRRRLSIWYAILGIVTPVVACASFANEIETSDDVTLEVFTQPQGISLERARRSWLAFLYNREGWVRLDFMVDTTGRPYEVAVTESVGHKGFQTAAVRALRKSKFEPAKLDGQPVDAGHHLYYDFAQRNNVLARPAVLRNYRALTRAVEQRNRDQADEYLERLERWGPLNLLEDAYLHVAKSGYYATWGDERQQLKALDRAVNHPAAKRRLPKDLYVSLQSVRFHLLVATQDYQRAIDAFETLAEYPVDEADLAPVKKVVDKLEARRSDNNSYSVPGNFGDRFSWSYNLFKDEFYLDEVDGKVAEIKLRCARKYVMFRFDPEIQYKVKQRYQPCHLELIGDPGTTFTLTQL